MKQSAAALAPRGLVHLPPGRQVDGRAHGRGSVLRRARQVPGGAREGRGAGDAATARCRAPRWAEDHADVPGGRRGAGARRGIAGARGAGPAAPGRPSAAPGRQGAQGPVRTPADALAPPVRADRPRARHGGAGARVDGQTRGGAPGVRRLPRHLPALRQPGSAPARRRARSRQDRVQRGDEAVSPRGHEGGGCSSRQGPVRLDADLRLRRRRPAAAAPHGPRREEDRRLVDRRCPHHGRGPAARGARRRRRGERASRADGAGAPPP
ncbi:Uncharacterised protein [Kytococcus sedentarius]|nr:Uncharacterised protein [Kytococcus sedentarius]